MTHLFTFVLGVMVLAAINRVEAVGDAMSDEVESAMEECMSDTGVDKEMIKTWKQSEGEIEDDHCLIACVLKKIDAMTEDGKLDMDIAIKKWKPSNEANMKNVPSFDKCKSVVDDKVTDDGGCKRGLQLINCAHKAMKEVATK